MPSARPPDRVDDKHARVGLRKATGNSCSASESAVCHFSLDLASVSTSVANPNGCSIVPTNNAFVPTSAWAQPMILGRQNPDPDGTCAVCMTRVSKQGNSYGVVSEDSRRMTLFLGGLWTLGGRKATKSTEMMFGRRRPCKA
jgi:hypothetical protein